MSENAIYNPKNLPVNELPVIYGFNNGGSPGWFYGVLLAEDGECLGSHVCSSEGFMWHDLGILAGTRPDRHETFMHKYPDGYRMEFVSHSSVDRHDGLQAALAKNKAMADAEGRS